MLDFAAIDFETANAERTSVCSVGIIVVRGGEIVHRYYSLIRPEPDYYNYHNTRVHGLTAADTESARIFPDVWAEVEPLIAGLPRGTQQAVRRRLPQSGIQDVPNGLPRLPVLLHAPSSTPPTATPQRSSSAHRSPMLRIYIGTTPPSPDRCRSLCRHRPEALVENLPWETSCLSLSTGCYKHFLNIKTGLYP